MIIDKEQAMKPYFFMDVDDDWEYCGYGCPRCKMSLYSTIYEDYPDLRGIRYCVKCGQRLDWSDEMIRGSMLFNLIEEGDKK